MLHFRRHFQQVHVLGGAGEESSPRKEANAQKCALTKEKAVIPFLL